MLNKSTKFLLSLVIALFLCSTGEAATTYATDLMITKTDGIWTDSRAFTSIGAAVTNIGALERDLYIAKEESVTDLTIPANIRLHFLKTGAINNSGQLTINTTQITAKDQQIFTGTGDIDFADGTIVRSTWFSDIYEALDVTSDDTITVTIAEPDFLDTSVAVGDDVILRWEAPFIISINPAVVLSNLKNIDAGDFQLFAGLGDIDFLDGTNLKLPWFNHLRSANTWIENEEVTLTVTTSLTITLVESLTSNIKLDFKNGASIDGVETLTLVSPEQIIAPPSQNIFGASILVVFTNPGIVYPEWWYTTGTYAAAVTKANISGGGTLDFLNTTYDLTGIAALGATFTNDIKWISSNRQATLTNVLTEKLAIPAGLDIYYENLKFDTWWSPLDTYYAHDSVIIKSCHFNNVKRACQAWPASVYTNSNIGYIEITNNVVESSENGFIIKSLVGSARITGNYINGILGDGQTYGICVGDHDDNTGTLQANTTNINISNNIIKDIDSTSATETSNGIIVTGTNIVIADNVIEDIDGTSADDVEAIYTKGLNVTITGNSIRNVNGTSAAIILKGWLYSEATNPKGNKIIVSNNTLMQDTDSCAYGIALSGASIPNTTISNNIIEGFDEVGIYGYGTYYNLSIKDNIIRNTVSQGGIVFFGINLDRTIISGNLIEGVTGGAGGAFGIKLRNSAGYTKDLIISNNMIRIDALVANAIDVTGIMVSPGVASENYNISNNDLQLTHDTVAPYGIDVSSAIATDNVVIYNNQFHDIENPLKAITFSRAYAVYSVANFVNNVTNVTIYDNFAGIRRVEPAPIVTHDSTKSFRIIYDFDELGGTVGNHAVEVSDLLPTSNVVITKVWYYVVSPFVSGTSTATFGLSFPAAGDYNIKILQIITSSGIIGKYVTIIDGTVANMLVAAAPGDISINVGGEEITAGIVNIFVEYVEYR